jgi:hypothetical protein
MPGWFYSQLMSFVLITRSPDWISTGPSRSQPAPGISAGPCPPNPVTMPGLVRTSGWRIDGVSVVIADGANHEFMIYHELFGGLSIMILS